MEKNLPKEKNRSGNTIITKPIINSNQLRSLCCLTVLIFMFLANSLFAQQIWYSTIPNNNYNYLSTGNTSGSNPIPAIIGVNDGNWKVATAGGFPTNAVVIDPNLNMNPNCGASPSLNTSPFGQWITHPAINCNPQTSGNYSCSPGTYNGLIFSNDFVLTNPNPNPAAPVIYNLYLQIFARGWVQSISVNGFQVYKSPMTTIPNPYNPSAWNSLDLGICKYWVAGLNHLEIQVLNTNISTSTPACQWTGIKVHAYPNVGPNTGGPSIAGPANVCPKMNTQYSLPIVPGIPSSSSFNWTQPSGWSVFSTPTRWNFPVFTGNTSGVITYTAKTNSNAGTFVNEDCHFVAGYSVAMPGPVVITGPNVVCSGAPFNMSATGATNYTWRNTSFSTLPFSNLNSVSNPNTVLGPNSFVVTGQSTSPIICTYTSTKVVNVLPVPFVTASATPSLVCAGNPITFNASGNAVSYKWFINPPGHQWIVPTPTTITIPTPFSPAVTATGANGCTSSAIANSTVYPLPNVSASANPASICPGAGPVTLNASGATNYTWLPSGPFGPSITLPNVFSTLTFPVQGGNSFVVPSAPNGTFGCTSIANAVVTMLNHPIVTINPPVICPGISNVFSATGATNYNWIITDGNQTFNFGTSSFTYTPITNVVSYQVCGSTPNMPCTTCTAGILNAAPVIPLVASNVTMCTNAGPTVSLVATSSLNVPTNYTWSGGPIIGNANSPTVVANPTVTQTYLINASSPQACPNSVIIKVDVQNNCCSQPTTCLALVPNAINGGTFANQSFLINNDITINGTAQFADADFWITPGKKITIMNAAQLDLSHVHMFACGINMWEGIEILDGGRLTSNIFNSRKQSSLIEDAHIAIKLDGISVMNSQPNPPIDIQRTIFNRNFIGIQVSNSDPNLNHLDLGISGCVFTSRNMTYSTCPNTLFWPSSDWICGPPFNGLRCPGNPTTGLVPPFTFSTGTFNYPQTFLKQPYNNQIGHIGIKIDSIGGAMGSPMLNAGGNQTYYGVEFGDNLLSVSLHDFNLFDGLGVGIDVKDANLVTRCNVFQNMQNYPYGPAGSTYGGQGIKHVVTDIVNRQLALTPMLNGAPTPTLVDGNHFWNCPTGIFASNVYEVDDNYSIFRSTRSASLAMGMNPMPGDTGISYHTNRFNLSVMEGQFNNVNTGIFLETDPTCNTQYSVAAGTSTGICADAVYLYHNYFGAEPTSTTPYSSGSPNTSEYMRNAIVLSSPCTSNWFNIPNTAGGNNHQINIISNKIDRAFNGIAINGMWDMPTAVQHNSVNIEDDYTFNNGGTSGNPATGYGIAVENKLSNVSINNNTLTGQYSGANSTNSVSLIYCNYIPNGGANITCNLTYNSKFGFEFSDWCYSTNWSGNNMCGNWSGLALTSNGVIGPQGAPSPGNSCANSWSSNCFSNFGVGLTPWYTYVDGADAGQSPLFCLTSSSFWFPTSHGTSGGISVPYNNLTNINSPASPSTNINGDCYQQDPFVNSYPLWRNSATSLNKTEGNLQFVKPSIIPNPTSGKVSIIKQSETDILQTRLFDISGKLISIFTKVEEFNYELDLSNIPNGIYILEITINNEKIIHEKLIKTN